MYTSIAMAIEIPKPPPAKNRQTSFRFTDEFKKTLQAVAEAQGVSQAAVIEYAVNDLSKRLKIKPTDKVAKPTATDTTDSDQGQRE